MLNLLALAIFLGTKLSGHPLSGINAEFGALDVFTVRYPARVFLATSLHPIIAAIVCNLNDLIEDGVCLLLTSTRVHVRECLVLSQPLEYRRSGRNILVLTNRLQAFTIGNTVANDKSHLIGVFCNAGHCGTTNLTPKRSAIALAQSAPRRSITSKARAFIDW